MTNPTLTEVESKQLLTTYGIPTVETLVARSSAEAVACAETIGYPVVLKLFSETLTHKSEQMIICETDAVHRAYHAIADAIRDKAGAEHFLGVTVQPMIQLDGYELILGSSTDPPFGPVLLVGSGGQLVEVYRDRTLFIIHTLSTEVPFCRVTLSNFATLFQVTHPEHCAVASRELILHSQF